MTLYLITLLFFGLAVAGMAVGVLVTGRRIKGSCGGLNSLVTDASGRQSCSICGATYEEQAEGGCGEESPSRSAV